LGGDEFTVLLDHIKDPSDAKRAADRMMKALAAPFILEWKEVFTSVSIGIALSKLSLRANRRYPARCRHGNVSAKSLGKARYEVSTRDMRSSVMARLQLETDFGTPWNGENFAFLSPIVALASEKLPGFEALLRWQHQLAAADN